MARALARWAGLATTDSERCDDMGVRDAMAAGLDAPTVGKRASEGGADAAAPPEAAGVKLLACTALEAPKPPVLCTWEGGRPCEEAAT
jgi:hypothetical protein